MNPNLVSGTEPELWLASYFEKKLLDSKRVLISISIQAPPSDSPFHSKKGREGGEAGKGTLILLRTLQ